MATTLMNNRWTSTASSIWIQATTGGSYAFSIYSPALKSSQSYDQSTLDTISVFKDIGANAGVLSGLLYAAVLTRRRRCCLGGPWVVHAVGAAQCFVGYLFMWLAVVGFIAPPPVPVMCGFMFLAAHAQTFFNTANVVTGVENFHDYKGTIVGIMKGFLGLSGAILIQVYQTFFKGSPSTFILLLAFLPSIVSLSLMFLVRICPGSKVDDKKYLNNYSIVALTLAAYLMFIIILENIFVFPKWAHIVTLVGLLILLSSPLKISVEAFGKENADALPAERDPLVYGIDPNEPEKILGQKYGGYDELPGTSNEVPPAAESMNLWAAMKSLNFWLLFVAMSCGMGSGLATINNMSQIGQSLGYDTVKINSLVSLWSIWNFLGRFGGGYVSDILLRGKGWPRPLLMAITLATMTAGHITIGSGFSGNLYIGTVLVGICYGAQWSLMPTITSEIFGILHMGTIFNTIAIASPVGTYILSVWVIGHIYDKEAGGGRSCYGVHCFMESFVILAFVSFLGFLVALTLFFRTRAFYQSVVIKNLHRSV
ncbi:protein NUCLEAR FUSION DEFECTIVE 4-like [Chenopodium quinoa]|uniref:Nodulin-like domain-containing protein n=1 Tax=Chenopodium quinoa TaxID=63459 RepID=A0A803M1C5_CHEQI|nr:protein NUCLEAR FUSION DEFECTIVE 4-like [Chenopodium quinoa]